MSDLRKLAELLLETLQHLNTADLKTFWWYLRNHKGHGLDEPIKRGMFPDNLNREDTVDLMVNKYEEKAVDVTEVILRKMNYNHHANELKKKADILKGGGSKPSEENPNTMDDCYSMTSLPRGLCLIMNNQEFEDEHLMNRQGSNIDAVELAKVFSWLGFKVLMSMNNTMKKMQDLPQHGDALVCCVLSHGRETGVCGTDSQILPIDELLSPFNGLKCPALNNKPKLFFIQACRGGIRLPGVFVQTDGPAGAEAGLETDGPAGAEAGLGTDGVWDTSSPVGADTLVVRATVNNNVSFRHKVTGSWFIQSLCQELRKGCPRDDILTIILRVSNEVSQRKHNEAKQMPEMTSTLRKKLFLPLPQNI
uniref:Caspase-8 n=1 Tax=Esox lucius TaxID=8010 RepID=A0A3P8ZZP0_ESOLU